MGEPESISHRRQKRDVREVRIRGKKGQETPYEAECIAETHQEGLSGLDCEDDQDGADVAEIQWHFIDPVEGDNGLSGQHDLVECEVDKVHDGYDRQDAGSFLLVFSERQGKDCDCRNVQYEQQDPQG